ncbi:MAG: hypothetical protein SYNGOMJ08_00381 [Candidatus Syntrophoarchaeum sp. GoM_oil]|nr:MAG: hypothetical protein SYNGOMJ08_00381 [Candidatus Syntrophoarchaeum sp. GoM_oil]
MAKKTDKTGTEIITEASMTQPTGLQAPAQQTDMDKIVGVLNNGSKLLDQIDGILTKGIAMKGQYLKDSTNESSQLKKTVQRST